MILICIDCVIDNRLKHLINNIKQKKCCSFCEKNQYVIDVQSNTFIQMIKAIVRYYYDEFDYNNKFGGKLSDLFTLENNKFFTNHVSTRGDLYDELINIIETCEFYEEPNNGVSLVAGYGDDGIYNMPFFSIKNYQDNTINKIIEGIKKYNYFVFEDEILKILKFYKNYCKINISESDVFYRARLGYQKKEISKASNFYPIDSFIPYSDEQISAPPIINSFVGRANRAGVSFLYCATDQYTAVSEIRPHPGDFVSIGKFIPQRNLALFDLSDHNFLNFYQSDTKLEEYKQLNNLSELMHKIIPPSEREHYSITQLIADCIRKLGFDGIRYNSTLSQGYNIVLFNPSLFRYTEEDAQVIEINKVQYDYNTKPKD